MQTYINGLFRRKEILRKSRHQAELILKKAPDGHLDIVSGRKISYYFVKSPGSKRIYIPKKNISLAKALAAKSYAKRLIRRLDREMRALDRYSLAVTGKSPESLFSELCRERQVLVNPILMNDEICASRWEQTQFIQSTYHMENKVFPTKKGDLVRSKSEAIIADAYYEMGIPYRYDQVLNLKDGESIVPDFSVWDKKNRKEIYHEHCGLMDDPLYRKRFLEKIDIYRRNGIYTGKNLILTFEGEGTILNINEIRTMLEELFL